MKTPRIVCAANRGNGEIFLGARHFDERMRNAIDTYLRYEAMMNETDKDTELKNMKKWGIEQGFIDQFGTFYNRQEAWVVAEAAGQIIQRVGGDGPEGQGLFSENLY